MQIIWTRELDPDRIADLVAVLQNLVDDDIESFVTEFKSADQTPQYVRIVADLVTWSNVFKVAATAFLAKLGSLAAEDLWSNKAKITNALQETSTKAISLVAWRLREIISDGPDHAAVLFSIPTPTDFPGTNLSCPASSEEEIAVYLACFTLKAESIAREIERFQSKHNSKDVAVSLLLLDSGAFKITMLEFMRGIEESVEV